MDLTEEGRFFFERAKAILQQMDELEEHLSQHHQTPSGRLRVNAALPFMLHAIVPWIGEFRALYPQIQLELNTNDLIIDLLEQSTDIAIRIGHLADSSLHARSLGCSPLHVLASPAYLARRGTPRHVEELAGHSLLGFTQPESLNDWPLRGPAGDTLRIQPTIASSSGETLRHMALAGLGVVCLSDFMTREDRKSGKLVQLFAAETLDVRQSINAVYYRNTALAARITCFVDYVMETLGQRPFTA